MFDFVRLDDCGDVVQIAKTRAPQRFLRFDAHTHFIRRARAARSRPESGRAHLHLIHQFKVKSQAKNKRACCRLFVLR
jgi:hypothetical protein